MKRIALLLPILLIVQSFDIRQALETDPTNASMNTRNYEFFPDAKMTPAPAGYKPFYISQYARHGARTDGSAGNPEKLLAVLDSARSRGLLTPAADTLYREVEAIYKLTKGHEGALVPSGQREHEQLAERLLERYGKVFKEGAAKHQKVRVKCTTSHRVLLSMAAFTNRLTRNVPALRYEMTAAPVDGNIISNGPSDRIKEETKAIRDTALKGDYDYSYLMNRLFSDPEQAAAIVKPSTLEMRIYQTARFSKPLERPIDLYRYLSADALYRYWLYSTMALYLYNCNSAEFGDERLPGCQPLVDIILDNAEDAITNGNVCADLFFGHDYPILALASRFRIEGIGERLTAEEIATRWTDPTNISFASNLQMIFFRNKEGSILVKFIYNDRERKIIGLEPVSGCYYKWEDIKCHS